MLAADKLQLQSALKQQATALKEKEFNLHHSNLMTVGTQAAVLAGLDITMFIEFQPPPTDAWEGHAMTVARILKFLYYVMIITAFCSNMVVVAHTTTLSVIGAGLALRGPDGSMMTATDGLYEERRSVFSVFAAGLACTVGSVVLCVWLILHWEAAVVCMVVTMYTCWKMHVNYRRVMKRFDFDESETVDFHDIFNGPASIRVMSSSLPGPPTARTPTTTTPQRQQSKTKRHMNGVRLFSSSSSSINHTDQQHHVVGSYLKHDMVLPQYEDDENDAGCGNYDCNGDCAHRHNNNHEWQGSNSHHHVRSNSRTSPVLRRQSSQSTQKQQSPQKQQEQQALIQMV